MFQLERERKLDTFDEGNLNNLFPFSFPSHSTKHVIQTTNLDSLMFWQEHESHVLVRT